MVLPAPDKVTLVTTFAHEEDEEEDIDFLAKENGALSKRDVVMRSSLSRMKKSQRIELLLTESCRAKFCRVAPSHQSHQLNSTDNNNKI